MVKATPLLFWSFVALSLAVAGAFVAGVHRAARGAPDARALTRRTALLTGAWLAATLGAAAAGVLHFDSRPPTMVVLFAVIFALTVWVARSRVGTLLALQLPLAALVGFQGFRVGVELLLHRAYVEGLMPVQMSYAGRNFDVISGATALALAALLAAGRAPRWTVWLWNALGTALLANILTIALLSAPTPFRVFHNEPANVWVTRAPWVWLPTVLVLAALLGHLLVFRRLRFDGARYSARSVDAGSVAAARRAGSSAAPTATTTSAAATAPSVAGSVGETP